MADFLSIKGENPFRIRAYERAADVLEHLSGDLKELYQKGKLKGVPDIGKGMQEKIEILLSTGTFPAYQQLRVEFPPGLIEILSIPEVGPKTVKLLYEKVGVRSVEDLERAVQSHKLRDLPGMGDKTEGNVLKGIKLYRMRNACILLGTALPLVNEVILELKGKASPWIEKISPAGSLRRGKETIGDIDILVTSSNSFSLMDAFVNLSSVDDVLAEGETKSSISTSQGLQIDLRVVAPESFGAAIQYFTGSKSHNINLRERAIKKGLKINEYGVFTQEGKKIAGEKEEEVYKCLDLSFIPPELRENRGEIEVAEKGELPHLLVEKDIKGDFHMHTTGSDGKNSIEDMVQKAGEKKYQYIAITDHSFSLKIAGGLSEQDVLSQAEKIKKINSSLNNFRIFSGTEVNIGADGTIDFSDEVLEKLDIVIAAVHTGFKQDEHKMTSRVVKALQNPYVKIFAHPTGRLLGEREAYAIDLNKVMQVAKDRGIWLEINSQPQRLDLNDIWVREAKRRKIPIVITTDAHSKEGLDLIKLGVITARRGWLEKEDVINTIPLRELLTLLKLH
ncbi:DNA polymerase/3'-5' exonuclease PolX [Patescibacteria group bacterium]|nr:DNA polymerase/3'-5' exonuclease PolX [Patescibacteria group bacterium]